MNSNSWLSEAVRKIEADFNFVLTESGKIIEIQGTAETNPIEWNVFNQMCLLAQDGIKQIFNQISLHSFESESVNNKLSIKIKLSVFINYLKSFLKVLNYPNNY